MVRSLNRRLPLVTAALMVSPLTVGTGSATAQEAEDCGDRASLSVLVTDESGTMLPLGATVVLRWLGAERMPVRDAAGPDGRFQLCIPEDARGATLWAEFDDGSSEQAMVAFAKGATTEVELRILTGPAGTGRIMGQVNDGVAEAPVVAASVSVLGSAQTAETNRRGRFVLSGLPVGEHELQVRHPGYAPLRHRVTVDRGLTTGMEIGLVTTPAEMEPLVATVTRPRRLEVTGFYERKLWGELLGIGTFLTADYIERWQPSGISHLVSDHIPGIRRRGVTLVNTAGHMGSRGCPMAVYVNGTPLRGYGIGGAVRPNQVAGVEVYQGLEGLPSGFRDERNRCGAVVAWTK